MSTSDSIEAREQSCVADACLRGEPFLSLTAVMLFALAAALRFWHITHDSIWFDEAITARFVSNSLSDVFRRCASETNPPLYFVGLWIWRHVFGMTELALRSYSAMWSLVGLGMLWRLARSIAGVRAGLIALAFGAISPLGIYYAQEARSYSQAAALSLLSGWLWWRLIMAQGSVRSRLIWILSYAAAVSAMIMTHYVTGAVALAQGLVAISILLAGRRPKDLGAYALSAVLCGGVAAVWASYVFRIVRRVNTSTIAWIPDIRIEDLLGYIWHEFPFGMAQLSWPWMVAAGCLAFCALAYAFVRSAGSHPAQAVTLLALMILPVALAIGAKHFAGQPVYFRSRFATLIEWHFLLLIATAISRRRGFLIGLPLAMLYVSGYVAQSQTARKTDWRSFASAWNAERPYRTLFFPTYNRQAAAYYLGDKVATYLPDQFFAERATLAGKRLWIVRQKDFWLGLQTSEHYMINTVALSGEARTIPAPFGLDIKRVTVGDFVPVPYRSYLNKWHEPWDLQGVIEGFDNAESFGSLRIDPDGGESDRIIRDGATFRLASDNDVRSIVVGLRTDGAPLSASAAANGAEVSLIARRIRQAASGESIAKCRLAADNTLTTCAVALPPGAGMTEIAIKIPDRWSDGDPGRAIRFCWFGIPIPAK